jgi:hypothetical protein
MGEDLVAHGDQVHDLHTEVGERAAEDFDFCAAVAP